MIWFYLATALSVWAIWMAILDDIDSRKNRGEYRTMWNEPTNNWVLAVFVITPFVFEIALIIGIVCGFFYEDVGATPDDTQILSVADSVGVKGRFTLGSGRIESEMYYFFYVAEGTGYRVGKITANNLVLYDDQETTAFTRVWLPNNELKFWGLATGKNRPSELHIPKGAIIKDVYELDLK